MNNRQFVVNGKGSREGRARSLLSQDYWASTGCEAIIGYVSFILLLLSCVDDGISSNIAKLFWLSSVLIVAWMNVGTAIGLYITSVAIFSVTHFADWGSIFERPDNFALVIIILCTGIFRMRQFFMKSKHSLSLIILIFFVVSLLQMGLTGTFSRANFAWFMRMFGLPFIIYYMLANQAISLSELTGFLRIITLLGLYMATVSIMEWLGLYSVLFPPWIADTKLNVTIGIGRSGGLLLQSEYNGFALGLIFSLILGSIFMSQWKERLNRYVISGLCLIGIFFTYTRGAWVAVILASPFLLWSTFASLRKNVPRYVLAVAILLFASIFIIGFSGRTAQARIGDTDTIYYRFNVWAAGLEMAKSRPLFGFGFGQFKDYVIDYETPLKSVPKQYFKGAVAHNTFISILAEQGIVGLMLYLFILFGICSTARHSAVAAWPHQGTGWVLAFVIIYIVNIQFITAFEPTNNFLFYGTLGLISGLGSNS